MSLLPVLCGRRLTVMAITAFLNILLRHTSVHSLDVPACALLHRCRCSDILATPTHYFPNVTNHVLSSLSHPSVTIQKSDPDVIVGHEFLGVSLDVLLGRMKDLNADHWSRIGRFRRAKMNLGRPGTNLKLLYGRLVCDLASDGAKVRD